jgi:lipoprotein-anchoring transpeptidase ErfK/SrfK
LIAKQEPPVVNKDVVDQITQDNSYVVISLAKQRAWVMFGEAQVYIDTPISSGKRVGMTPTGKFTVMQKDPDHRSSVYGDFVDKRGRTVRRGVSLKVDSAPSGTRYVGAPMKFFCRLTGDGVGMHVGKLPGYPASHGCVRLPEEIAPLIYAKVKLGTPVEIKAD